MQLAPTILATIGFIACGAYALMAALKFYLSLRIAGKQHHELEPVENDGARSIAIIQPILAGDPFLEEMLRRNIEATSSHAHFYWMIDENDALADTACRKLAAEFPQRVSIVVCPPSPADENPKVFKLTIAAEAIDAEYLAVLDDDTCISDETLGAAMNALRDCDLATGLPCYEWDGGLWSSLVTHFVNNNSITTYLPLLNFREPISINGMFYVMRTDTAKSLQPFHAIADKVCDDYELACFFRQRGLKIRQLTAHLQLKTHVESFADYRRILHRWFVFANRLVRDQSLATQATLAVLLGLPPVLLWLSLLAMCSPLAGAVVLAALFFIRDLHVRRLHQAVFGFAPRFSWWRSIVSELLQPVHLIGSLITPAILWRGKPMRIARDGGFGL